VSLLLHALPDEPAGLGARPARSGWAAVICGSRLPRLGRAWECASLGPGDQPPCAAARRKERRSEPDSRTEPAGMRAAPRSPPRSAAGREPLRLLMAAPARRAPPSQPRTMAWRKFGIAVRRPDRVGRPREKGAACWAHGRGARATNNECASAVQVPAVSARLLPRSRRGKLMRAGGGQMRARPA
jgi:hypothetical protein